MIANFPLTHGRPHQNPPQRTTGGMGDGAISAGLVRMVRRVADPADRDGLVLSRREVEDICAGLAVDATVQQRQTALRVTAVNHEDWTGTEQGRSEVRALRAFLAPDCDDDDWAAVVHWAGRAEDAATDAQHSVATAVLHDYLSAAVTPRPNVIHLPRRHHHDGPGAA